MQNFFLPEINGLLGIFLIVLILVFVLKEVKNSGVNGWTDDEIFGMAKHLKKHAELDLEADNEEELRRKVQETFKAWSQGGKKRELPGDIMINN